MVKLSGPMLSQNAVGSIPGSLTFANLRSQPYAKKHAAPRNPKSAAQVAFRLINKWLAGQWSGLSDADQQTWIPRAHKRKAAPYHAYLSENMLRYLAGQAPATEDPAPEDDLPAVTVAYVGDGGFRTISSFPFTFNYNQNWGQLFHRSQTDGFQPNRTTITAIRYFPIGAAPTHHEYGVPAGTWYARVQNFSLAGVLGPPSDQLTAIVTDV